MAASFTGAYFSRDTTDNTSLYLTLYGGTGIPAESSYDNSYSYIETGFHFNYPSGTNGTFTGIGNKIKESNWAWNADRTGFTIPMSWNLITSDNYNSSGAPGGEGDDAGLLNYGASDENIIEWATGFFVLNGADSDPTDWNTVEDFTGNSYVGQNTIGGIRVDFRNDSDSSTDLWENWDNSTQPHTYNSGNMQVFNAPVSDVNRKNVYSTDGFKYSDISAYSSSGGATGDPHITTFNGNKYTL